MLGATDQLQLNVLDSRDRTCMHYAAIKGKQTLINTLYMLFKSNHNPMRRAKIDPNAQEDKGVPR